MHDGFFIIRGYKPSFYLEIQMEFCHEISVIPI